MDQLDTKNVEMFRNLLQLARPDIFMFMEMLDATNVNARVLNSVIRQVSNIANGTRFGKVTIEIENGQVTFVRGEESDKLFEKAISTPVHKHNNGQD